MATAAITVVMVAGGGETTDPVTDQVCHLTDRCIRADAHQGRNLRAPVRIVSETYKELGGR